MLRNVQLPLLPGISSRTNVGQTKFHRSQHCERINNVLMVSETIKPGIGGVPLVYEKPKKFLSVAARGESANLPAWLAFDKQVLCFEAFFQETAQERSGYTYHIRKVKILLFMEDGTIQVVEPAVKNSGIPQGTLIIRHRIPFPAPQNEEFYGILDFNIGKEVELYGRVFKITNCDRFTRDFLNRTGIHVPDPIDMPPDPYTAEREKLSQGIAPKKPKRHIDKFGQFLDFDRKVLRFYGYWDDRESVHGMLHNLEILYYLADDTIGIKENIPENSGRSSGSMFLQRCKLPKVYKEIPSPGPNDENTMLNIVNTGFLKGLCLYDALNCGQQPIECYKDCDLAIGVAINVFGRKVVLTDCDTFTKEYYAKKYGLDDFTPHERPKADDKVAIKQETRPLPPYNGYGTYQDSAANCRKIIPVRPPTDFNKFLSKDRSIVHTEMKRSFFNETDRLQESFLRHDPKRNGHVSRDTAYTVCRGAKLPVEKDLLNAVLDKVDKNEAGEINYKDLLEFLDLKENPPSPIEPTNTQCDFTLLDNEQDNRIGSVNYQAFLKDLDLEKQFLEESGL